MAKESSFDCVSQVDVQEVDNAFQQARKELSQRYDLKGTGSTIAFDKSAEAITVSAPSDFVARQIIDILTSKLVKRKVDLKAVSWGDCIAASGGTVRIVGKLVQGIEKDLLTKMNKDIKAKKFKAKVQIEGDKLRVSSPSKDILQEVIAFLKGQDYGIPLQFTNYR